MLTFVFTSHIAGQTHLNVEPTDDCYQSHEILDSTAL